MFLPLNSGRWASWVAASTADKSFLKALQNRFCNVKIAKQECGSERCAEQTLKFYANA